MPTSPLLNGYYWTYLIDGSNASISTGANGGATTQGQSLSGAVIVPSVIGDYTVTKINGGAFAITPGLTSLTIPDSVTFIDQYAAFKATGLTSVTIGNAVTFIGWDAFGMCNKLNSVTIGNSVTTIDGYAFRETLLTSINIPNTLTTIGTKTFWDCSMLSSINIPNSVTSIGTDTFLNTSANLVITMNTGKFGKTSPSFDQTFFGNTSVNFVEPPPLTMTITSTTVTSGSTTNNTPIALTFTSSASTTDFVVGDISVTNGTLSPLSGSGTVYTATFTPNGQGPVACTISVAANKFTSAGQNNTASNTFTFTYDAAPTMTITSTTAGVTSGSTTNNSTIELTFTATEAITGFQAGDISFNRGSLAAFDGSGSVYTATFTQGGQGAHIINVPIGSFADAAGNSNTTAASFNWNYDSVSPSMDISSTTLGVTRGSTTKTINVTNGTLSDFTSISSTDYTATFTPIGQGLCTIDVLAGAYTDAATNLNNLATQFAFTFDSISPTMTITSTTAGVTSGSTTNNESIALTFTSSKSTTNFAVGDISATNGTLSGFASSSATVYTATFAPTSPGACTIGVASGAYTDAVGNNNAAANTFSVGYIPNFAAFNDANNLEQTYIAGFLDVSGEVIHRTRDLTVMDGNVLVSSGNVSLNSGNLYVGGNGIVNSGLMVNGPTTLQQMVASTNIDVSGATRLDGAVTVSGLTTFNNNVGIANNKTFTVGSGNSAFGGDVSMNSTLRVAGDVSLNSTLSVNGLTTLANTAIAGTMIVNGKSTFTTDMSFTAVNFDICGNLRAQYPANSIPLSAIKGGGSLSAADVSMNAGLSVAGATTLSTLTANGNTAFGGTLTVTGASTLAELTATGNVTVGDTLVVTEKTVFGTDVSFNGSRVDICGNFYANYPNNSIPASAVISSGSSNVSNTDLSMNANLSIAGATTFASTLAVAGKTTFLNDVSLGTMSGSRVDICGNLYATYIPNSIRQSAIMGGVGGGVFNTDVSMNARLSVKNSIRIDSAQMQYTELWNQLGGDMDGQPSSTSGRFVSLSKDGSRVAIGNSNRNIPVRVYTRDINNAIGWSQLGGDISLNITSPDYSEHTIALSGDGSIVVVGTYSGYSEYGTSKNTIFRAVVFQYQSGSSSWSQLGGIITQEATSDLFGSSVALSNDGFTVAIGAPSNDVGGAINNAGHVRVFRYSASKTVANTTDPSPTFGPIGWNRLGTDLDGLVSADYLGWSVALSSDGNTVACGAPFGNGAVNEPGNIRVFRYTSGTNTWAAMGAIIEGNAIAQQIGATLALSADGTILATSNFRSSTGSAGLFVRTYKFDGSAWGILGSDFTKTPSGSTIGLPVSLSSDGTILAIGSFVNDGTSTDVNNNIGCVDVYQCPVGSSTWTQIGNTILGETAGDGSGMSVSLSGDGSILAIGSTQNDGTSTNINNNCGQVRVYNRDVRFTVGRLDMSANVIPTSLSATNLTIGSTLNVSGATGLATLTAGNSNVGGSLRVTGVTTLATLTSGNTSIGSTLWVSGATTFPTDASMNSTLTITSDVSINSPLNVGNDAGFSSTLYVNREVSLNSTLFVTGATTLAQVQANTLSVTGATTLVDTAFIQGNSTINGVLALVSPYTFAADASLNSRVTIARDVSLNSTLNVGGATTFVALTIPNNMTLNSTLSVVGATTIAMDVSANARLLVTGATTLNSTMTVATTTNLAGTLQVTGATTASTLTASGATTIGGTLTVTGKTSIAGATTFNSTTVDVSGNLNTRTIGFPLGNVTIRNNPIVDWVQLGGDIDGEAANDQSGYSVSLSTDGSIVAIGAIKNDGTVANSNFGHVRVYQRNATNTTIAPIGWTQLGGDIDGEGGVDDDSGQSVSLSADGLTVAIGANKNDGTVGGTDSRGHVRVYKYRATKTEAVTNQSLPTFGPVGWDRLGADIDGEAADDYSGYSVSLSADGSTVAIGAYLNDASDSGHVRVYKYVEGKAADTNQNSPTFGPAGWTRLGGDIDGEAASDQSGLSVSLSADGSIVAIGAYFNDGTVANTGDNRGHVRVYKYLQGKAADTNQSSPTFGPAGWTRLGGDIDGEATGDVSGYSVSLSADGSTVAIGANNNDGTTTNTNDGRGHVRVYKYVEGKAADTNQNSPTFGPAGWTRLGGDIDGEAANDQFGYSVSLSADGFTVAIGALVNDGTVVSTSDNRGHVRVYKYLQGKAEDTNQSSPTFGPAGWTRLGTDIDGEATGDLFGRSVYLSADGSTVATGANQNDGTTTNTSDNRGHVRVFKYLPSGLVSNVPLVSTNAITTGDVTLYDNFNVTRATSLASTLSIVGASTLSNVNTSSNASVGGALTVSGATTSTGALNINGATTSTTLALSSNATIGGTLTVAGATTMQTLNVMGPIKKR